MKKIWLFSIAFIITEFCFYSCKKNEPNNGSPTSNTKKYKIGEKALGGIVVFLDASQSHGIVCSENDVDTCIPPMPTDLFGPFDIPAIYGTDSIIGSGKNNSSKIVLTLGNSSGSTYAASACRNYRGGGYNDWFLPSMLELKVICEQKNYLGKMQEAYWSSTVQIFSSDPSHSNMFAMQIGTNNPDCSPRIWVHVDNSPCAAIRACRVF